jgi:hypothetical protein
MNIEIWDERNSSWLLLWQRLWLLSIAENQGLQRQRAPTELTSTTFGIRFVAGAFSQ